MWYVSGDRYVSTGSVTLHRRQLGHPRARDSERVLTARAAQHGDGHLVGRAEKVRCRHTQVFKNTEDAHTRLCTATASFLKETPRLPCDIHSNNVIVSPVTRSLDKLFSLFKRT